MKKIYFAIIFLGLFIGLALQAQTAKGNSSVSAKKQTNGLYTITIKDSQGIKSFSLKSPGNLPYGGDLDGCPRVFVIDNVSPIVVNDFSGEVDADIVDCQNNSDELTIPEIGDKKAVVGKHEEPPAPVVKPAPAPVVAPAPGVEPMPAVTEPTTISREAEIIYPVAELGGCADKDSCKVYCEEPANMRSCVDFAEKYNLISKKEADEGRKFTRIVNSRGGGPGGCKTRESCEAFCENSDNIETCLAFAEDSGLVEAKELEEMRKVASLLKSGEKFPGGCKTKSQCEAYCAEPDNMEACLDFAERAGFIPPEELEMARKVVPLMKAGKTPGGCKSKEACETYCEDPDNFEACIAFAEKLGAISPEELAIIKKTGGKGPGGCRGRQQCEDFCQAPENQEACYNFAKDNDLISEDDLKQMEEGMGFIRDALSDESSELGQCLSEALGPDNVSRIKGGQPIFDRNLEDKLKGCFEQSGGGFDGPGGPGGFSGPGGCKSQEECQAFCEENPEECEGFAPPGGGGGGFSGPGGCASQEECQAYCEENPEECEGFEPPSGGGGFPGGGGGFPGGPGGGGFPGGLGGGFGGPGGCKSQEECQAYCEENPEECGGFSPPGGGGFPGGPGDDFGDNGGDEEPDYAAIVSTCVSKRLGEAVLQKWVDGIRSEQILRVYKYCLAQAGNPDWDDSDYAHITPGCNNRTECEAYCEKTPQNCVEWRNGPLCERGEIWNGAECLSYPSNGGGGAACPDIASIASCGVGEERFITYQSEDCGTFFGCRPASGGGGEPGGGGGGTGGTTGGPGGCTSAQECITYCTTNYTDPACAVYIGGGAPSPSPTPIPAPTSSCAPVPSGIVSWWPGDTPGVDIIGGNNVIDERGVTSKAGKVRGAVLFSGGYINMGNPANLNFGTGPFSLEAWFNWNGGGSDINNIIRKSNYGPGQGSGYWLRIAKYNKTIEFSVGATTQAEGQSLITAPISSGAWHHVAAIRDSSDNIKLYIDGQSTGTIVRKSIGANSTSGSSLALGAWADQNSEFFSGLIDDVSVYNRALSASEVQAIFNAGSAGKCSNVSSNQRPFESLLSIFLSPALQLLGL